MRIDARTILIAPIISEKSHDDLKENKYYFQVSTRATKTDVERAVKEVFNVKVEKVNIINKRGKQRSINKRHYGNTPKWKKAVVTINKDQKIAGFFEGM